TRRVWGWGEAEATPCPRHATPTAGWVRTWPPEALMRAFGAEVQSIRLTPPTEPWGLVVLGTRARTTYGFDEVHRRIAAVLGWDALPSPADRVDLGPGGLRLEGVGQGHRVGLCLAE
ncbi:MAG TPA: hypothetical protein VJ570_05555, partial [Holophagaceae bacterium]|nr:hypothetical protein [Holophagaceae bacterium]